MEREACVCDHGFERSDLCTEIIIPTFDHSSTLKRRPQQSLLQTWCGSAPCRGPSANGYDAWRLDPADPRAKTLQLLLQTWVCAPPRTIRKWLRRQSFWIPRTRAQDPCSCCCRPGVGLRPASDHSHRVTTPVVLDPADPGARSLQLLLQTWCGSAPRRGPSANGYDVL